jgi:uncharacterized SAM-binding protein YcdF (DUF218 family)
MSCLKRCVALACGAVILIAGLAVAALACAGRWLQLTETPRAADAIVVLAGSYERSLYAADLFAQHYAPAVYLSIPVREPGNAQIRALGIDLEEAIDIHRQILLKKGVPAASIRYFGQSSVSTAEEAVALKARFNQPGAHLLVVTSPYHTRRAHLIFRQAFENSGVDISVVGTPYEDFRTDWWRSQNSARNTLLELVKLFYFFAGGRFTSGSAPASPG